MPSPKYGPDIPIRYLRDTYCYLLGWDVEGNGLSIGDSSALIARTKNIEQKIRIEKTTSLGFSL